MPKQLTTAEFIRRAKEVHGEKYDYSKVNYTYVNAKVEIVCPKHGSFYQSLRLHVERRNGCLQCGKSKPKRISRTADEFFKRAKEIHGEKYDYTESKYQGATAPIVIRCLVHGLFTIKSAHLHNNNKNGCQKCRKTSTLEYFINKGTKVFNGYYQYHLSKYKTIDTELIVVCPRHGEQSITPADHYRVGCWFCKRNRSQDIWLDELGIPNTKQTRQVRIRINDRLFVVDGMIENVVYLFHGDYWHGNPAVYESTEVNKRNGKTFGELYQQTLDYENALKAAGYTVSSIWEYNWLQTKKECKCSSK